MKENDNTVGEDEKQEFEGIVALRPDFISPIKCKKCNEVMTPQVSDLEYILHCQPCRRAVVVSDWNSNSELIKE